MAGHAIEKNLSMHLTRSRSGALGICEVVLDQGGVLSSFQSSNFPFDVGDEQLVAVALGHDQYLVQPLKFRLSILIQGRSSLE